MYNPREDSFLLISCLDKYIHQDTIFLEIGAGSGIISEQAKRLGAKVLAIDVDKDVVQQLKKKINARVSNLFDNIKKTEKFDIIVFNPPYLPEDKHDKQKDTSGGKRGDETILKFLEQAKLYLNKKGKVLLLLSTHTPRTRINKLLKNYHSRKIAEEKLFFETLEVLELS